MARIYKSTTLSGKFSCGHQNYFGFARPRYFNFGAKFYFLMLVAADYSAHFC